MDIRFDKLSAEAQLYALKNNVDGGKLGVIEEANGELQTLLNGLGKTDASELMADTVQVSETNSRRASDTTRPTNEQLEKHYNNASNYTKAKIMINTINEVQSKFATIDHNIEEATNEVLGIQKIVEPLYETSGDASIAIKNALSKLDNASFVNLPNNLKVLVKLFMNQVAEKKNEALKQYKETIKDEISSYDAIYVRPYQELGPRIIPDIQDAVQTLTFKQIELMPDNAAQRAFGMSAEEFAEQCESMSQEDLVAALETYVEAMDFETAKVVQESIMPAVDTIRDKMSENYTQTMKSIVEATQNGDVEIPNPIEKTATSNIQAILEGTYKKGNINTADTETVYTFLRKINEDYQNSATGIKAPNIEGETPKIKCSSYKTQTEIYNLRGKTVFVSDYSGKTLRTEPLNPAVHKGFFEQE